MLLCGVITFFVCCGHDTSIYFVDNTQIQLKIWKHFRFSIPRIICYICNRCQHVSKLRKSILVSLSLLVINNNPFFYRRYAENLRWKSVPRCALQNAVAVDTRLCAGSRPGNARQVRTGQNRSAALLFGSSKWRWLLNLLFHHIHLSFETLFCCRSTAMAPNTFWTMTNARYRYWWTIRRHGVSKFLRQPYGWHKTNSQTTNMFAYHPLTRVHHITLVSFNRKYGHKCAYLSYLCRLQPSQSGNII